MTRVGWGKGKREVLVLKDEILGLLQDGTTLGEVHSALKQAGKLTLGYTSFTIHVKGLRQAEKSAAGKADVAKAAPAPAANMKSAASDKAEIGSSGDVRDRLPRFDKIETGTEDHW